jgi:hypothetical protein
VSKVDQEIAIATSEPGKPHTFYAAGPSTFDCSGLITFVFAQLGISLPHNAAEQQKATSPVSVPLPGDLVFFGDPATHVGLYIGGGKMISAPHTGAVVHITDVGSPTGYGRVAGLGTVTGTITAGLSTVASPITDWLGGARFIVLEGLAVGFGVGLLGFGVWRTLGPGIKKHFNQAEELLS